MLGGCRGAARGLFGCLSGEGGGAAVDHDVLPRKPLARLGRLLVDEGVGVVVELGVRVLWAGIDYYYYSHHIWKVVYVRTGSLYG